MFKKVQCHFTKRVTGLQHLPYSDHLPVLGLHFFKHRRINYDIILVYKIIHGLTNCKLLNNLILQQFNKTEAILTNWQKAFVPMTNKHFLLTMLLTCGIIHQVMLFLLSLCILLSADLTR